MKRCSLITVLLAGIAAMLSCGGKSNQQPEYTDGGDSTATYVIRDSTIYGLCGDGSAMNTLELLTDSGDTLHISVLQARENGHVLGGYSIGDRMAIMLTPDSSAARLVINQSAMLGDWVMPNPIDGSDELGISLKEGGIAEGIQQSDLIYKTWRILNGKLEILAVRDGSDTEEIGIYDILKITADSLVFRDSEDIYEYGRQKPFDNYGVDIDLEDGQNEFHL